MKSGKTAKFISLVISVLLSLSVLSFAVYAQDEPAAGVQLNDQQLKQETAETETTEHQSGGMPSESRPAADSETETEADTETGTDSPNQQDSSTGIETRSCQKGTPGNWSDYQ